MAKGVVPVIFVSSVDRQTTQIMTVGYVKRRTLSVQHLQIGVHVTMGNICCGSKEEGPKPSATFVPVASIGGGSGGVERSPSTHDVTDWSSSVSPTPLLPSTSATDPRPPRRIVQAAGRAMVSLHTRRTDRHYYSDQGFAAALAQHLQERMPPPAALPLTWPPLPKSGIQECLYDPPKRRNRMTASTLDQVSDAILERAVPPPERLWAAAPPMMENLL